MCNRETWITILNDLGTYAGLGSAVMLALPAVRAAALQGDKAAIEAELSADKTVRGVQEVALRTLTTRIAKGVGADRRAIKRGLALLVVSGLLFGVGIYVQAQAPNP
jgi:uncharacterized membrane protein YedE/YeeE